MNANNLVEPGCRLAARALNDWTYCRIKSGKGGGVVESVFTHSLNWITPGGSLLAAVDQRGGAIPFGLSVEFGSRFSFKNLGLQAGDMVTADSERLIFGSGRLCLDCSGAERDAERLPACHKGMELPDRRTWQRFADRVDLLVPDGQGRRRLRRFLAAMSNDGVSPAGADPFDRKLISCLIGLQQAAWDGNASEAARWATALIGTGVGLTPSGDDILVGILAAWSLQAGAGKQQAFIESIRMRLLGCLAGRTTRISEAFLYHALQGRFSGRLMDFAVAVLAQKDFEVEAAATRLLAFGASSGLDSLCGVVFGCGTWVPDAAPARAGALISKRSDER